MPTALARLLSRRPRQLVCGRCGRDFLCPIEWEPHDAEHWHVDARCGACGVWHALRLSNAEAAAWDLELDRQTRPIELEWRRLDRERMAREGDAFVIALRRDLIDAADFA